MKRDLEMKVKRILSFLLVVVIAVSLVGCTSNEYCSSLSEAYENNKTQNSAIYIKRGITKADVSDDVVIWIARNNKKDIVLAPMMVKNNKYYFSGKESDYYIPNISRKCVKSSMWNSYSFDNGAKLKVHLIRAKTRKIKEADGCKVISIKKRHYMVVWTYEK